MTTPTDTSLATMARATRRAGARGRLAPRTWVPGSRGLARMSAGQLVTEAARADVGVDAAIGEARRERIAAELEQRRLVETAEAVRADIEAQRRRAEAEAQEAIDRAHRAGVTDTDLAEGTLAVVATIALMEALDSVEIAAMIDHAVLDRPELDDDTRRELQGAHVAGLTPEDLAADLAEVGADPTALAGCPAVDLDPAERLAWVTDIDTSPTDDSPSVAASVELTPEVG